MMGAGAHMRTWLTSAEPLNNCCLPGQARSAAARGAVRSLPCSMSKQPAAAADPPTPQGCPGALCTHPAAPPAAPAARGCCQGAGLNGSDCPPASSAAWFRSRCWRAGGCAGCLREGAEGVRGRGLGAGPPPPSLVIPQPHQLRSRPPPRHHQHAAALSPRPTTSTRHNSTSVAAAPTILRQVDGDVLARLEALHQHVGRNQWEQRRRELHRARAPEVVVEAPQVVRLA